MNRIERPGEKGCLYRLHVLLFIYREIVLLNGMPLLGLFPKYRSTCSFTFYTSQFALCIKDINATGWLKNR